MDYKETLNLPKTDFPMKANLVKKEPEMIEKWEREDLYHIIRQASKGRKRYMLHDGPPYANGNIHMGTAFNKILKDIIIKSKQMAGFDVPYVPGWDCHGLPIEHKADTELGPKKAEMSQVEIRQYCREYAKKYIDIQRNEFKRLGVLGEWERPYLTMNFSYEATIIREFGKFALNGSLVKSKKPIHWCTSCKTALAEAEVEYAEHTSPSIFVKFPMISDLSQKYPSLKGKEISIMIWTTTPWTIPANLAIALHPDLDYVALDTGNNQVIILARGLMDICMDTLGIQSYQVIAEFDAPAWKTSRQNIHSMIGNPRSCWHPMSPLMQALDAFTRPRDMGVKTTRQAWNITLMYTHQWMMRAVLPKMSSIFPDSMYLRPIGLLMKNLRKWGPS